MVSNICEAGEEFNCSVLTNYVLLATINITQLKQKRKHFAIMYNMFKQNAILEAAKMEKERETNIDRYNATFPTILRALEECHPADGRTTTHKALAAAVGVRPQTISLYASGETQPTSDSLLKIAQYFEVSVDYLLTGVSADNKATNETLGLSEDAIQLLKRAKEYNKASDFPSALELINSLLGDRDFYGFLDDLGYKASKYQIVLQHENSAASSMDLAGYYLWDLQMFVQEFIRKELVKNGLAIDVK